MARGSRAGDPVYPVHALSGPAGRAGVRPAPAVARGVRSVLQGGFPSLGKRCLQRRRLQRQAVRRPDRPAGDGPNGRLRAGRPLPLTAGGGGRRQRLPLRFLLYRRFSLLAYPDRPTGRAAARSLGGRAAACGAPVPVQLVLLSKAVRRRLPRDAGRDVQARRFLLRLRRFSGRGAADADGDRSRSLQAAAAVLNR